MQLRIDRLTDSPGPLRHTATAGWWAEWCEAGADPHEPGAEPAEQGEILGELVFDGTAHAIGEDALIEGALEAEFSLECARCAKRYRQRLREPYRLLLEPLKDRAPSDPEGAEMLERYGLWLGEELETGFYRGKEVDLAPFYAEVVASATPVQPICREDCSGLCPHCGIDRSQASCECTDEKPESPFAVLAALRGDPAGSS